MLIGYVPRDGAGPAERALRAAGCGRVVRGGELGGLVEPGDVVVVARLADLAAGRAELVDLLAGLVGRCVGFRSLAERIDSAAAGAAARLVVALAATPSRAGRLGRPPRLDAAGRGRARALLAAELPADQVAALLGVSRATLYRHLRRRAG